MCVCVCVYVCSLEERHALLFVYIYIYIYIYIERERERDRLSHINKYNPYTFSEVKLFLTKDIRILSFIAEHYTIKTDIISYYLLSNYSLFLHKVNECMCISKKPYTWLTLEKSLLIVYSRKIILYRF